MDLYRFKAIIVKSTNDARREKTVRRIDAFVPTVTCADLTIVRVRKFHVMLTLDVVKMRSVVRMGNARVFPGFREPPTRRRVKAYVISVSPIYTLNEMLI